MIRILKDELYQTCGLASGSTAGGKSATRSRRIATSQEELENPGSLWQSRVSMRAWRKPKHGKSWQSHSSSADRVSNLDRHNQTRLRGVLFRSLSKRMACVLIRHSLLSDAMNKAWHRQHPMPKNPTVEQRVKWHLAHSKECGCRPIPSSLEKRTRKQA